MNFIYALALPASAILLNNAIQDIGMSVLWAIILTINFFSVWTRLE